MKYFPLLLLIFVLACDSTSSSDNSTTDSSAFANCKYGSPKPIFNDAIPLITSHSFESGTHAAVETVFFDADTKLELTQSGCEKPKQAFQFTLPGNSKDYTSANWIDMALGQLDFLGNLHKPLEPLLFWSAALKQQKEEIKLGQPIPLEQGHFVKIDKVAGEKNGVLIIELYQE